MPRARSTALLLAALAGAALAGWLPGALRAGPLDPPVGPPAPTRPPFLDEIERAFGAHIGSPKAHVEARTSLKVIGAAGAFAKGGGVFIGGDPDVSHAALVAHELAHVVQQGGGTGGTLGTDTIEPSVLTVVKTTDKATPKLLEALCSQEPLQVQVAWWQEGDGQPATRRLLLGLEGARVQRVRTLGMPSPVRDPDGVWRTYPMEEVSFVFDQITWTGPTGDAATFDATTGACVD